MLPNMPNLSEQPEVPSTNVIPENIHPDKFCAFCLRERPPNHEFFKHIIGCNAATRRALQLMLGYDFRLVDFAICQPCWKLFQLVQDIRLRCFKATGLAERLNRGLPSDDGWFSAQSLAIIESVRLTVRDQTHQIGKINLTRRTLALDDATEVVQVKQEPSLENPPEEAKAEQSPSSDQTEEAYQSTGEDDKTLISDITISETKVQSTEENLTTSYQMALPSADQPTNQANQHAEIRTYACREQCNAKFPSRTTRIIHEESCAKIPLVCMHCRMQLPNYAGLAAHLKAKHTGERCESCGKGFVKAGVLRTHEKCTVTVLPCSKCGKVFKHSANFKSHMKIHEFLERAAKVAVLVEKET